MTTDNDVVISRPLSISENFFRSRTASGYYRNFAVTSTYSQCLSDLTLFFKALRKTLLDYHILASNVQFEHDNFIYKPLDSIKLGEILQLDFDPSYFKDDVVTENYFKKINETVFELYTQQVLFKLVLINNYTLTCVFEHTIGDGVVGNYFHEIFLRNLAFYDGLSSIVEEETYGVIPKEINLQTEIFNFAKDQKYLKNSLPPPIDLFLEDMDLDYSYGDPNFHEKVTPSGFKRWKGRFNAIDTHEISFKLMRFNLETTKLILNACKQNKVTLTSYILVIQALTLEPIFGDNYATHKVAMTLRRHINEASAPKEYKKIISDPNYKILGTSAHMGFGNQLPPIKQFSWDLVTKINNDIISGTKNKRALNQLKGWKDKGDLKSKNNQDFFNVQLNKPKADHIKFSNLGLIKLSELETENGKWTINDMIFHQDMAPYSAEFMLSAISTPIGGLNLVLSYYDYSFDDVSEPNFDSYIDRFYDNMVKYAKM